MAHLPGGGREIQKVDLRQTVVLRLDADGAAAGEGGTGDGVNIHAGRQGAAQLVIGVVAADLRPARGGEQAHLLVLRSPIESTKAVQQRQKPPRGAGGLVAVDTAELLMKLSALQTGAYLLYAAQRHHSYIVVEVRVGIIL